MAADEIPKAHEFLLKVPMYQEIPFAGEQAWDVLNVLYFDGTYDSYCPKCSRDSTFQCIVPERPPEYTRNLASERALRQRGVAVDVPAVKEEIYKVIGQCSRIKSHLQSFLFLVEHRIVSNEVASSIQKIGQHPSYGDLNLPELKKYSTVLTPAQLGELKRAVSLASHDVGVGAYVYLRRVFETLVEEAHQLALIAETGWDESAYLRSRMSERIELLKHHLPTFLVEHPEMYSLLSKGVHELSEQECLKHFDTLRIGIELILDEKLERQEKQKKINAAKAALAKAVGGGGK
jgi:hypothetical protein